MAESIKTDVESITNGTMTMVVADPDEPDAESIQQVDLPSRVMLDEAANHSEDKDTKDVMLDRLSNSEAHFKHQQRGDPDLTYKEKYDIAEKLLNEKPAIFLSRFGSYLAEEDLCYFDFLKSDYVIAFHLKEIKEKLDRSKNKMVIRNRRYRAMEKMLSDGSYFSNEEMKARDPLLYEQLVGQYLTVEEKQELVDSSDTRLSTMLMKHMDVLAYNAVYDIQKEIEKSQMEESDEDESDDGNDMDVEDVKDDKKQQLSDDEREMLWQEFMTTMQLRFLDGKDEDFDYTSVDGSAEFDALDLEGQDAEDKYFDEADDET